MIRAALGNAILLLVACAWIGWEAVERLINPQPVASGWIIAVAGSGFLINLATALLFLKDQHKDLNVRGAYLHMMADAAVSRGVLAAGIAILFTGVALIDPIISLVIVVVILWSTWGLLKDSLNLALDAAPAGMDVEAVRRATCWLSPRKRRASSASVTPPSRSRMRRRRTAPTADPPLATGGSGAIWRS